MQQGILCFTLINIDREMTFYYYELTKKFEQIQSCFNE